MFFADGEKCVIQKNQTYAFTLCNGALLLFNLYSHVFADPPLQHQSLHYLGQ